MTRIGNVMGLLATASAAAIATPAAAQNVGAAADSASGDVIIVTAQRRDESLSRTPVSVAVLSSDTLAEAQIVSEQDLRVATPGLNVRATLNSNQLNYALRGQSQDAFSGARPGVLPYVNEVQIGGGGGSTAFYDLESVQVLRGPQGTLFGRSSTGGAVLFTTASPTDETEGYVSGMVGNYDAFRLEGAINLPIAGDSVMARFAGFYDQRDGFQRNLFDGGREGDSESYGLRGSLTINFSENVINELVVDYYNTDSESIVGVIGGLVPFTGVGAPFIPIEFLYAGTDTPIARATGIGTLQAFTGAPIADVTAFYDAYFADPTHPTNGIRGVFEDQQARGPYVVDINSNNVYRANNVILTNSTTFEIGPNTRIKNIFGYVHLDNESAFDADGTPYGINGNGERGDPNAMILSTNEQFSNELQLIGEAFGGDLDYVVGVYFSDEEYVNLQPARAFDIIFGGIPDRTDFLITNQTYAAYAQGTYALNDDGLSATIGARYTSEKVGIQNLPTDTSVVTLGIPAPAGVSYDQSNTFNRLSWTLGLQYQVNPDLLLYAASRRAYKSGGFNGQVLPRIGFADVAGNAYRSERVTDAEIGLKFQGYVGASPARLNLAMYYDWIHNSQRTVTTIIGGAPAALTVNVPESRVYGAELDGQIAPADWLTLGGTLNYTHGRFTNGAINANGLPQVLDQITDAPEFSGSLYADIAVPITGNLEIVLHGDVYAQDRTFSSRQSEFSLGADIPGYALVNFRFGIRDEDAGWSLTANLDNAFDRVYYVGGIPLGGIYQINTLVPGEPRVFSVRARFNF